jgi:CheY-like chemotaxis protein
LGLPIAGSYVAILGGELKVDSELGKGTEFYFTIPVKPATKEISEVAAEINIISDENIFEGRRILVAEDDELNTEIAKTLLETEGFVVTCAENGAVAVDIFTASDIFEFDAILMDIRMPVMDGLEACEQIRRLPRPDAPDIPIIALSANAFPEDIQNSKNAGMTDHVIKPLDMRVLTSKLRTIFIKHDNRIELT